MGINVPRGRRLPDYCIFQIMLSNIKRCRCDSFEISGECLWVELRLLHERIQVPSMDKPTTIAGMTMQMGD